MDGTVTEINRRIGALMGTSGNRGGSTPNTPIVPPHADSSPGSPPPERPENGLRKFRSSLTAFAKNGGEDKARKAQASFVRNATGGASGAARRQGATSMATGSAIAALANAGGGGLAGQGQIGQGPDLSACVGRPIAEVAGIIAQAVAPKTSEGDHVATVIAEAVERAYDQGDVFDPNAIDETFLDRVLFDCIVESILYDVTAREGGASMENAGSPAEQIARENEMRQYVQADVDARLADMPGTDTITSRSPDEIKDFILRCSEAVFQDWEDGE